MTTDQPTNQTAPALRPGARVQRWWCEGCEAWHQAEPMLAAVRAEAEKLERERVAGELKGGQS